MAADSTADNRCSERFQSVKAKAVLTTASQAMMSQPPVEIVTHDTQGEAVADDHARPARRVDQRDVERVGLVGLDGLDPVEQHALGGKAGDEVEDLDAAGIALVGLPRVHADSERAARRPDEALAQHPEQTKPLLRRRLGLGQQRRCDERRASRLDMSWPRMFAATSIRLRTTRR